MQARRERRNEPGQHKRRPHRDERGAHEPFQQVGPVGLHQSEREDEEKHRHAESCQAEAALHEEIGGVGPQAAYGVLEFALLVGQLARPQVLDDALVGRPGGQIGHERPGHAHRDGEEQHPQEEMHTLVLENVDHAPKAQNLKERRFRLVELASRNFLFLIFCHRCFYASSLPH